MRSRVLERCLCSAFSACVPYSWKGRTDFALCHSLVLSFSFSFLCRKWFTLLNSHDQNARVLRAKEKQRPLVHSLAVVHVEVFVRSSSRPLVLAPAMGLFVHDFLRRNLSSKPPSSSLWLFVGLEKITCTRKRSVLYFCSGRILFGYQNGKVAEWIKSLLLWTQLFNLWRNFEWQRLKKIVILNWTFHLKKKISAPFINSFELFLF